MIAPVDVRSVLRELNLADPGQRPGLNSARVAVAELIAKAADKVADGCPCDSCEALRAAVRDCGGEA